MNAFICRVVSYTKMSSRDYLVASIERVFLQCNIVFAEVSSKDHLVASDKHIRLKCDE